MAEPIRVVGPPPIVQSNDRVLDLVAAVIHQHDLIVESNAKLLEMLGYPIHVIHQEQPS